MAFFKVFSVVVFGLAVAVVANHGFGEFEGHEKPHHGFDVLHQLRQNLTTDQKTQIDAVLNNTGLRKSELKTQLQNLFNSFGLSAQFQSFLDQYNGFIANITAVEAQITANLTSPTAKELADKTLALIKDESLTIAEQKQQTEALWKAASASDKELLKNALRAHFGDKHPGFGAESHERRF
uniref:Uncharacterized protein n=1 Tax=Panagrolaimus sp. JU765 TaxID=591449 RepID=A0AC34Q933_9BILA